MLLALSKFLPRIRHKRGNKSDRTSVNDSVNNTADGESSKQYTCRVLLLDDSELFLNVKLTSKGFVLLEQVFLNLSILEREYFGVRFLDETHQPLWLNRSKTIISQLPASREPPFTFYFGVKFYAVDPCKLGEEITRYQFFLQVKRDVLQGRLPVPPELSAHLAAFVVQSELGDYNELNHPFGYVSEFSFVPNQTMEFENRVAEIHRTLKGQVPAQAEYYFLDKVKWLHMYGVSLHPVTGDGNIDYFLGLTPSGINVYKNQELLTNYYWPRVLKTCSKGKSFYIKALDKNSQENKFVFVSASKLACKHLDKCASDYHTFYKLTSASHSFQQSRGKLLPFVSNGSFRDKLGKRSDSTEQPEPVVVRRPSQRKPMKRTSGGSASCPEEFSNMPRPLSAVVLSQPVSKCQRRDGYSSGPESSRHSSVAPWEVGRGHGLYGGAMSPRSVHSEYFPRRHTPGSESDSTLCSRHHRFPANPSDTETEVDSCHRRRRHGCGTESESDVGSHHSHHRHHHRHHHHHGRSAESVESIESQWRHAHQRLRDGWQTAPSDGAESTSSTVMSQRRHRKRSKSPGIRPPQELAQHFRKIEDPSELGFTEENFQNLPYIRVEVLNQRFSPRTRHRIRQYRRQKSLGELPVGGQLKLPDGEAPPPYLGPPGCHPANPLSVSSLQTPHGSGHRHHPHRSHHLRIEADFLRSPMAAQMTETHTAPIVKTREIKRTEDSSPPVDRVVHSSSGVTLRQSMPRVTCEYDQVSYQKEPQRLHGRVVQDTGLGFHGHTREDSGLDLESPVASSTSSREANMQQQPMFMDHSPIAGTPAPDFRSSAVETSPYIEQASSDNRDHVRSTTASRSRQNRRNDTLADDPRIPTHFSYDYGRVTEL